MVRAQFAAEDHQRPVFAGGVPGDEIEAGLLFPGEGGNAIEQAVEELGGRLRRLRADQEDAAGKSLIMVEPRVLDVGQVAERGTVFLYIAADGRLQGHQARGTGLEMHVVRLGRPAFRAVVENRVFRQVPCQVQHVHIAVPDRLVAMGVSGDDQVVGKDGIGVDLDVVEPALASFETQVALLGRPVFLAEETANGSEGLIRITGQGRLDAGRIALRLDRQATDFEFLGPRSAQGAEIRGSQRPDRQLVRDEFSDGKGAHRITARLGGYRRSAGTPVRN